VALALDGSGRARIATPVPFFNHMLELLAQHGLFDLEVSARGDVRVDLHHTFEDVGLVLGEALAAALGDKSGIRRYGSIILPMDEALVGCALDLCGRPYFALKDEIQARGYIPQQLEEQISGIDWQVIGEFFKALANSARLVLHFTIYAGDNLHHIFEALFKAFARALDEAARVDERLQQNVPSTKGNL